MYTDTEYFSATLHRIDLSISDNVPRVHVPTSLSVRQSDSSRNTGACVAANCSDLSLQASTYARNRTGSLPYPTIFMKFLNTDTHSCTDHRHCKCYYTQFFQRIPSSPPEPLLVRLRGAQTCQKCSCHLNLTGATREPQSKYHTENPQPHNI